MTYWASVQAAARSGEIEAVAATPGVRGDGAIFSGGGGGGGVLRFARWLSREISTFDVVHIHGVFSWPLALGATFAKASGVPYVVSSHGHLYPWSLTQGARRKQLYLRAFLRKRLHQASAVVATCDREAEVLRGFDSRLRIAVVPPGLPEWPGSASVPDVHDGALRLVFLNRIAKQKGLPTLFRSLASLRERQVPVTLDVVGDGPAQFCAEMKALCGSLQIEDRVRWRGFLAGEERFAVLRRSELFVLSSNMENFSFATAEALACGLPAVVSDQVALAMEILRYGCGRVVPVGDVDALADAIAVYSERRKELREHAERALQCASDCFRLDAMNRALQRTYEAAVGITRDEKN